MTIETLKTAGKIGGAGAGAGISSVLFVFLMDLYKTNQENTFEIKTLRRTVRELEKKTEDCSNEIKFIETYGLKKIK